MKWVASTLHTTSEHSVSSITTADAHTSAASCCRLWSRARFNTLETPAGSNLLEHCQIRKYSQVLLMMSENIARNM